MTSMFDGVITAGYDGEPVLLNVSVDIPVGACRLTGRNGVGKSLLLRTLAGVAPLTEGYLHCRGRSIEDKTVRRDIGYVAPEAPLYPELSIREHSAIVRSLNTSVDLSTVEARITHYALDRWAEHPVGDLSTGNKQKANIILSTLLPCRVLLLDEPFRGLDSFACAALIAEIQTWRGAGVGVVMVQHEQAHQIDFDLTMCLTRETLTRQDSPESGNCTSAAGHKRDQANS